MTRGERRESDKRHWFNKLKSVFNAKVFDWYKLHGENGRGTSFGPHDQSIHPKEWKDMLKTKDGVAYKETPTMWHNPKTEKDDYYWAKKLHKRDLANKSLSKEDKEELEYAVELMDNPYAWEDKCGACDYLNSEECPFAGKVGTLTDWKKLGCNHFMD